jgi:hypothetical protein
MNFVRREVTVSKVQHNIWERGTLLSIQAKVMDYGLAGRDSIPGRGKFAPSSITFRLGLVFTQPPIHWVPRAVAPGAKRQQYEVDHSPPFSAEVKSGGASLPPSQHVLLAIIGKLKTSLFFTARSC